MIFRSKMLLLCLCVSSLWSLALAVVSPEFNQIRTHSATEDKSGGDVLKEALFLKTAANLTHEVSVRYAGKGTVAYTIAPLPAGTDSFTVTVGSLVLTITDRDVQLSGSQANTFHEIARKSPACSLTHPRTPQLQLWVSISSRKPAFVKIGYGYRMASNVLFNFESTDNHPQDLTLKDVRKIFLDDNVNLVAAPEFCENPIILEMSPKLVKIGLEHMTDPTTFYPHISDLPAVTARLVERIASLGITDEHLDAINYSLDCDGCILSTILKNKGSFSSNKKSSYLRVPTRDGNRDAPGQDVVLEIWPKGHFSPVHNHGNSAAVIKVLQGTIRSEWYNPLVDGSQEEPQLIRSAEFTKGEMTWMLPHLFQTHKLFNPRNDTAAVTIQAYGYPEGADVHEDFFYYVLPGDPALHQFFPNTDISLKNLTTVVLEEYQQRTGARQGPGPRPKVTPTTTRKPTATTRRLTTTTPSSRTDSSFPSFQVKLVSMTECRSISTDNCKAQHDCKYPIFFLNCSKDASDDEITWSLRKINSLRKDRPIALELYGQRILTQKQISAVKSHILWLSFYQNDDMSTEMLATLDLPNLIELDIDSSKNVKVRQSDLDRFSKLRMITFHSCLIREIEEGAFDNLPNLMLLSLEWNLQRPYKSVETRQFWKFHCECEYSWLRDLFQNRPKLLQERATAELWEVSGEAGTIQNDPVSKDKIFVPVNCKKADLMGSADQDVFALNIDSCEITDTL